MDIDDVATAIAAAVNTAALVVNGAQVTATAFSPEVPTAPAFFVAEFTGSYDKSFGGLTGLTLTCRLMLSRADPESGQGAAQSLASTGAGTIVATLHAQRGGPGQSALGGAADDLRVQSVRGPRLYAYGEAQFYGLEFTVFVMG